MNVLCVLLVAWLGPAPTPRVPRPSDPTDSLRLRLAVTPPDSNRVLLLTDLAAESLQTDPLATIQYSRQALQLAQQLRFRRGEGMALVRLGTGFREAGNYPSALQMGLQGLRLAEALGEPALTGRALNALGYLYYEQGNNRPALAYFFRAKALAEKHRNLQLLTRVVGNIGAAYQQLNRLDSALAYSQRGLALDLSQHDVSSEVGDEAMMGSIYDGLGKSELARRHYRNSARRAQPQHYTYALCRAYLGQAQLFRRRDGPLADSAFHFARQALAAGQQGHYPKGVLEASQFLAEAHAARRDSAAAFRYLTLASATRDSLFSRAKVAQVQALDVNERLRQRELAEQATKTAAERRQLWLWAALASTLPVLLLIGRTSRQRQRANRQLNAQYAQIAAQHDELSSTLAQLKATQAQLMQAEKMAFLGELTTGIAHELQNPLAFVKNFAEVSTLLVDDMAGVAAPPAARDANQQLLLAGLKQNLREISQHGQRASSIITGILARSRHGAAAMAPTDLNALVSDALHLAYRGLRATNPSFQATLTTQLAPDLGLVPASAPDLSRALLNLFTNALYAVQQRQKAGAADYCAEVGADTRRLPSGQVEIRVRDNGTGMPDAVKQRVFEPFFTTKPAGEGTGLGLSLSHDIIAQGHGGTLTVNSREGEFTEFVICLPG